METIFLSFTKQFSAAGLFYYFLFSGSTERSELLIQAAQRPDLARRHALGQSLYIDLIDRLGSVPGNIGPPGHGSTDRAASAIFIIWLTLFKYERSSKQT